MNVHKYRQVDIGTSSHTDRQTKQQAVTYTGRQLGRKICRQADINTVIDMWTSRLTKINADNKNGETKSWQNKLKI